MCGIAGYVGPRATEQRALLERMSARIAHRGPDDDGLWVDEKAVLGHRRLSIIDTSSAGHQPMHSVCERYVLVYNGEIYNFLELRSQLVQMGHSFRGHSDTEVLLTAFIEWGPNCVHHLNGMWSFAIWDRPASRLFLSRDRFGEKPLYYRLAGQSLWFASEIKALLADADYRPAVNLAAVSDFACERISDHLEDTFFRGIKQLPAGHSATYGDGRLLANSYWELPVGSVSTDSATLIPQVASILSDAVRIRMRSDVPVGVLLSGGLDSSTVACLAADIGGSVPLQAFSTLHNPPAEEADGIRLVKAAYPQIVLHADHPGSDTLLNDLDTCLWHQEEPFADGSMLAHFRLMRLARHTGVRVLLTGQAADEVFGGYPGFLGLHASGLLRAAQFARAWRFMQAVKSSGQHLVGASVLARCLPSTLLATLRERSATTSTDWLRADVRAAATGVSAGYIVDGEETLNHALRACLKVRTLPAFLHYEDRNSMAFGVETRIPFLDHRLVELVLPLNADLKLNGARTKALLRDAFPTIVPAAIAKRLAKQGYPAPLATWLRSAPPAQQASAIEAVRACDLVDFERWHVHNASFMNGDDSKLPAVWRGIVLALWKNRFIRSHQ